MDRTPIRGRASGTTWRPPGPAGRKVPKPADEAERLETLRALKILDTDPEETFDRIAGLAARIFDVPIAVVSLVDEHREWFKAKCGVPYDESDRRTAFCAHTIATDSVLVVEDTREDERFADNVRANEEGVRFYAGAPLVMRPGLCVGAICIKDLVPRRITPRETRILEHLAVMVVREMEHRLVEAELRRWEFVFSRAAWGVAIAFGENMTLDVINPSFAEMHGFTVEELQGRSIVDVYAPSCRNEVTDHARRVREEGHHVFESLHVRKDGSVFPVEIDASVVRDRDGRLLYRAAHVLDITGRRREEEARLFQTAILRTQQETSLDGILVVDRAGTLVSFNQRFGKMWGIPDAVLSTRSDAAALEYVLDQLTDPGEFMRRVRYLYDHPRETSSEKIRLKDGRVFDRFSAPMRGPNGEQYGRVWYFRDETDRLRAERATRESEERLTWTLESAMDAIITIDSEWNVTLFNSAAAEAFRCSVSDAVGGSFERFVSPSFRQLLQRCEKAFARGGSGKRYMWAPEGLTALRSDGEEFPVEATISQSVTSGEKRLTIILRDVNERLQAERQLHRLRQERVYLKEELNAELGFEEIVGRSEAIQEVMELVQQVSPTESTVLLTGETGTGKELVARAIHRLSPRSERVLVKVNCASLPGGLIESELFGHEKGAFTGALTRRIGRFELADRGTIFLDEIGDLPLELQSKLLRVLQEGECERVGSVRTISLDVRVIAATNRDLEQAVNEGRFRADLYYRLNVFPVRIPPVRERRDDVPLLVSHFVMKHGEQMGRKIERVPDDVMRRLVAYEWPGNVRELQNVIERAVILSSGDVLELRDDQPRALASSNDAGDGDALEDVERRHIRSVLDRTGWRVSGPGGAAEILAVKRTTLESRMKRLGIKRPRGERRPR